jgi:hypothetical protein
MGNKRMLQLAEDDPLSTSMLVEEIVEKADGVFLWVELVIKSLMAGLTNYDHISRLRKRLRDLPPDLERLYGYMIDSIDPFYQEDAAVIFQLFRAAVSFPISGRSFNIPALYRALTVDFALTMYLAIERRSESISAHEQRYLTYERQEVALRSCCKGLLEVRSYMEEQSSFSDEIDFPPVAFMHRTVQEYVER